MASPLAAPVVPPPRPAIHAVARSATSRSPASVGPPDGAVAGRWATGPRAVPWAPARRSRPAAAVVILVCLVLGVVGWGARRAARPAAHEATVVVVRPGDTLWTVAERSSGGRDPRPTVEAIRAANHLADATLSPGATLEVP